MARSRGSEAARRTGWSKGTRIELPEQQWQPTGMPETQGVTGEMYWVVIRWPPPDRGAQQESPESCETQGAYSGPPDMQSQQSPERSETSHTSHEKRHGFLRVVCRVSKPPAFLVQKPRPGWRRLGMIVHRIGT